MKNRLFFLIFLCCAGLFTSCGEKKDTGHKDSTKSKEVQAPVSPMFNGDSAYDFVAAQVAFGPRVPNSAAHDQCAAFLVRYFRSLGLTVTEQRFNMTAYDGKSLSLTNIIVSINPSATRRVLLAAHWDTRPFADQDSRDTLKAIDGANDGGSGVAVLMEIARVISVYGKMPKVGVDIILFDGEDYGRPQFDHKEGADGWCLGSEYWSKNKHTISYTAYYGVLLDMVGAQGAHFAREERSMFYATSVVEKIWDTGNRLGYGNYFIYEDSPGLIDDHVNVNENAHIPMVDIIEYNGKGGQYFGAYWHTHNDNIHVIDPKTLKAVGQTLLEVIYTEE